MALTKEDLVLEIKRVQDNIREKHRMLRDSMIHSKRTFESQFKPLIEPLKRLTGKVRDVVLKQEIKEEPIKEEEEEEEPIDNDDEGDDVLTEYSENLSDGTSDYTQNTSIDTGTNMLESYLNFISEDTRQEADFIYGITYSQDGWKMGSNSVKFRGNDILVGDVTYKGTPGLFELIFKKQPAKIYTDKDVKMYEMILRQTQAHKGVDGKVKSNKGYKYTNIISKIFPPKGRHFTRDVLRVLTPSRPVKRRLAESTSRQEPMVRALSSPGVLQQKRPKFGEGLNVRLSSNKIDYKHWDDPNELCDRLNLLIASTNAGNNSHNNEMISILEELQEAGFIKDVDNFSL